MRHNPQKTHRTVHLPAPPFLGSLGSQGLSPVLTSGSSIEQKRQHSSHCPLGTTECDFHFSHLLAISLVNENVTIGFLYKSSKYRHSLGEQRIS